MIFYIFAIEMRVIKTTFLIMNKKIEKFMVKSILGVIILFLTLRKFGQAKREARPEDQ